jgi:hypothetical protein
MAPHNTNEESTTQNRPIEGDHPHKEYPTPHPPCLLTPLETIYAQLVGFLTSGHCRHTEALDYIDSRGLIKSNIFSKLPEKQQASLKPLIKTHAQKLRQMRKSLRKPLQPGNPPRIPLTSMEQDCLFATLKLTLEKTTPPDEETKKYLRKGYIKNSFYKKLSEEQKKEISSLSHQYRLKFYPKIPPKHLP